MSTSDICHTNVTLICAVPIPQRAARIVHAVAALGVNRLIPILTERTIAELPGEPSCTVESWRELAHTQAASCDARPMYIDDITSLEDLLTDVGGFDLVLAAWEEEGGDTVRAVVHEVAETVRAIDVARGDDKTKGNFSAAIIIGPEPGFTPREMEMLKEDGAVPITLGPDVLLNDTAAIVACALLQDALAIEFEDAWI